MDPERKMMSEWTVKEDFIPQDSDWASTNWTMTRVRSSVLPKQTQITVDDDLNVRATVSKDGTSTFYQSTEPGTVSDSGLLSFNFQPSTIPMLAVLSMIAVADEDGDEQYFITVLTLGGDPDEVGVMGGSGGGDGSGDDDDDVESDE